jgi:hypothetical protein
VKKLHPHSLQQYVEINGNAAKKPVILDPFFLVLKLRLIQNMKSSVIEYVFTWSHRHH